MKNAILLVLILICSTYSALQGQSNDEGWKLVYENDPQGVAVTGDIDGLIDAVRSGYQVRVGWQSNRRGEDPRWVEHIADAGFLTIMSGEVVFAQIQGILGQTPDFEKVEVLLKENLRWTLMAGSNGKSDAIMRDMSTSEIVGHNQRQRGFKWWVKR